MAGKGSSAGFDYEEEMAGLVALRLCNESNIEQFKLAMNHSKVEAVDDIIFSYNLFGEKPVTAYVQLKHFESKVKTIQKKEFQKEKDGFSLFKYYEAFKDVKSKKPIWGDINRSSEIFVLYTHANVDPNKLKSVEMFEQGNAPKTVVTVKPQTGEESLYRKLLSTGSEGKVYEFAIISDENVKDKKDFFDNLLLFVKQSNVNSLKHIIREGIRTMLGLPSDNVKLEMTATNYIQHIKRRKNSTEKKPFTREEIVSQVIQCYAESLHIASKSLFTLPDSDVAAWNKMTADKKIIVVNEYKVGYVNMLQFCIEKNNNKHLCLNLTHLSLNALEYLSKTWPFNKFNPYETLVLISEEAVNHQQKQFLEDVITAIVNSPFHKIIIACKNIDDIVHKIPVNVEKLGSLNDLGRDNFLMEKPITYSGVPTTLGDFVGKYPGVENCFKTHHLLDLFLTDLNIGTKPRYDLDFYIPTKARVSVLKPAVLKCQEMKDVIVCISGDFNESELNGASYVEAGSVSDVSSLKNCHFITIPYDGSSLKHLNIFSTLKQKLHTMEFILVLVGDEDNGRVWRIVTASDAAKQLLKEYIHERDVSLKVSGDITILTGEPGMGKSTFCQQTWQKNVNNLVPTFIITHTDLENLCNLKELLDHYYSKNNSDLTNNVFSYHCSNKNVLFILDAFDELSQAASTNALQVLKDCMDNNYNMLITTRPFVASKLEDRTEINSQRLKAFDKEQQIHFFKKYWQRTPESTEVCNKINEFASRLLEVVRDSVNDKDRLITGVPLQCKMLGEIYEQQCRMYIESSDVLDNLLPTKLNIVEMYEQCIEKKFEIFCADKMKFTRKANETVKEDIVEIYTEICQKYSLVIIFSDNAKLIEKLETFLTKSKNNIKLYSSGIFTASEERIIKNKKFEIPIFVHRTYAEYFAALFLSENWAIEKELVNLIWSSREYDTVRYFFDLIVAKNCPLITATIRNDTKQIINEIANKKERANINERDTCGRCALHLVAIGGIRLTDLQADGYYTIYNNKEICQVLLEHGIDVNCEDNINKWKPIRYADKLRVLHIINELLKNSINDEDVPVLLDDLKTDTYMKHDTCSFHKSGFRRNSLFHSVSSWGFTNVVKYLLPKVTAEKLNVYNLLVNNFNQTPLHLAVNKRHVDIIRLLLTVPSIINVANKIGNKVLHYSARKGCADVMKVLLDNDQVRKDIDYKNGSGMTALHVAAENGHVDVSELLLEAGAKTDIGDKDKNTLFHFAAGHGNSSVIEMLLRKQQFEDNINHLNAREETPIHIACEKGYINVVKLLLMAGADPYIANKNGLTILHIAVQFDKADIAKFLLEHEQIKRNINIINSLAFQKNTALHLAVKRESLDNVKLFLDAGAKIHSVDVYGDTPLLTALHYFQMEMVRLLLSYPQINESVNFADKYKNTPLHYAVRHKYVDIVRRLIELGANLNAVDRHNNTPLFVAVLNSHVAVVQYLLDNSEVKKRICNINITGQTILHLAMTNRDNDIIIDTLLSSCKCYVNYVDKYGMTPLHYAAQSGFSRAIKLLLSYDEVKKNINSINIDGQTPLNLAVDESPVDAIDEILTAGADVNITDEEGSTVLHLAARRGNVDVVRRLLENEQIRQSVTRLDKRRYTPLHVAVAEGHFETVKLLLSCYKVNNNIDRVHIEDRTALVLSVEKSQVGAISSTMAPNYVNIIDKNGEKILHLAARQGKTDVVRLLLENDQIKQSVNHQNIYGNTVLHVAAVNGHFETVKLLLSYDEVNNNIGRVHIEDGTTLDLAVEKSQVGAISSTMAPNYVNILNQNGRNALHLAARQGETDVVRLLLENEQIRQNINHPDKFGHTALHEAVANGHVETVKLLLNVTGILHTPNIDGNIPLHIAASEGQDSVAKLLCNYENINSLNKYKQTALHLVAEHKCNKMIYDYYHERRYCNITKLLLRQGIDYNAVDGNGQTALQLAKNNQTEDSILEILKNPNKWMVDEDELESTFLDLSELW